MARSSIGGKGIVTAGTYGTNTRLLPDARMEGYEDAARDPGPRVKGSHYRNWIEACKGGDPACSNFDYAGPFTEMVARGEHRPPHRHKGGIRFRLGHHQEQSRRLGSNGKRRNIRTDGALPV